MFVAAFSEVHFRQVNRDGFTHRPWPRSPHFWGSRATLSYDDSMLTKNLQNCAET